ncbi:MAG: dipeptide/oligopeptide/nickel ABC transporter ATP-binding protein [Anaerovoracaceae bacterium]|jgi:oligopeptide transport system ATP-binding protein
MNRQAIIEVKNISKSFPRDHRVLQDISFTLHIGDMAGLMGPSGCGKTTLAKIMVGLLPCDSGQILYRGQDILSMDRKRMKAIRPKLQMVFQDYRQSLHPNLRVGDLLTEALVVNRLATKEESMRIVLQLMEHADLPHTLFHKYPRQLSGGEAQRIALIRAVELEPELLILDEVTSGLDSKTAAKVIDLIRRLCGEREMAVLVISHDLHIIRTVTDRVLVLEDGRLRR